MKTLRNTHIDVLLLLDFTDLPDGNLVGDAHVVLDDGTVAPTMNIDVDDTPYLVLGATDAGLATPCEVVSVRRYDTHGPRGTSERLRIEVRPIAGAEPVQVTP